MDHKQQSAEGDCNNVFYDEGGRPGIFDDYFIDNPDKWKQYEVNNRLKFQVYNKEERKTRGGFKYDPQVVKITGELIVMELPN